jgi:uncharacterized protein YecE (DUF72 family)
MPSEKAFTNWREGTPDGFLFSVKASRYITHVKNLKDCRESLNEFLERATNLQDKLGPFLYQLPAGLHRDDDRLESFLRLLPLGLKHVFEFRHESWLNVEVFDMLRRYNIGLCVFDMAGLPCPVVTTSDFGYIRFHGPAAIYSSSYPDDALEAWADRIKQLAQGLDRIYIYFNNDTAGYAIKNAGTLKGLLRG